MITIQGYDDFGNATDFNGSASDWLNKIGNVATAAAGYASTAVNAACGVANSSMAQTGLDIMGKGGYGKKIQSACGTAQAIAAKVAPAVKSATASAAKVIPRVQSAKNTISTAMTFAKGIVGMKSAAEAPKTKPPYPPGSYYVKKGNGRYDIYASKDTKWPLAGLGDANIEILSGGFEVLSNDPFDILSGNACLFGDCGLGGDTLIDPDVADPRNAEKRPWYKNPMIKYGAIALGGVAVLGGGALLIMRRKRA